MKYREKLGYITLGAFLMLVGVLAAGLFSPVKAQNEVKDAEIAKLTCRAIEVVDETGSAMIRLETRLGSGRVSVYGKHGGTTRMSVGEYGGQVGVFDMEDAEVASVAVTERGGGVSVVNRHGLAHMGVNEHGGKVAMIGNRGASAVGVDEHGGRVDVIGEKDKGGARLGLTEHGGVVAVFSKDGITNRAGLGVNEYGNGEVSTWDKDGYRLATLK